MKVSVCVTVFNEKESVGRLIESLLKQTKKPDEIVFVDGGSSDKTVEIINSYKKKSKIIKVYVEKGSCAHGRNVSIDKARHGICASTDAGCIAKPDWLEKITEPFSDKKVGLVAGFYDMQAESRMQEAINTFHGVMPSEFDPDKFLPSARSVAFRKSVWEKAGGYSEELDKAGEDTLFFYNVVKLGVKIVRVKSARVVWEESAGMTFKNSVKKFFQYAKGDAQAGIWWHPTQRLASHNIKIFSIFLRYFVGLVILVFTFGNPLLPILLLVSYSFWAYRKTFILTKNVQAGLWGVVVQYTSDIAVMCGFTIGVIGR